MSKKKLLCLTLNTTDLSLAKDLGAFGWDVHTAANLKLAGRLVEQHDYRVGVVFLDVCNDKTCIEVEDFLLLRPGMMEWIAVVDSACLRSENCAKLVLNCFHDHFLLPADSNELSLTIEHAERRNVLRKGLSSQHNDLKESLMIGNSTAMKKLLDGIRKIARVDAPVLIVGESGTGKELAALMVHKRSGRAEGPFIAVNCGALPANLIQSELFGFEKGAFTGAHQAKKGLIEAAEKGTIFLDEIGDLPLELQINLLRFLQEKTFNRIGSTQSIAADVRVITATHVNLEKAIGEGRFREDLYYRLNVLHVAVPALRERADDILLLAQHFFEKFSKERRAGALKGFSHRGLQALVAHNWPGNVRELINRVQRAIVMCDNCLITRADLGLERRTVARNTIELDQARDVAELNAIKASLWYAQNNISQAARELGVSRVTLYRLMGKHRLTAHAVR